MARYGKAPKGDKRYFKRTANRVHKLNLHPHYRGGSTL